MWYNLVYESDPRLPPKWTPDGKNIVFTLSRSGISYSRGLESSIYVARSDGSGIRRVSKGTGEYNVDYFASLSPDGSRIAYATSRHLTLDNNAFLGVHRNFEIETSTLNGFYRRRLTKNGDLDTFPVWSPSGDRIAFVRIDHDRRVKDAGIYTMKPNGSDVRGMLLFRDSDGAAAQWVRDRFFQGGLAWSPDGQKLAFVIEEVEKREGVKSWLTRSVLYTVRGDGSELKRLLTTSDAPRIDKIAGPPAWSPDRQNVAVLRLTYDGESSSLKLLIISPEVGDSLEVPLGSGNVDPRSRLDSSISWSPDGTRILFSIGDGDRGGSGRIYVVNPDGSGLREITRGFYPAWSPDGSRIAFLGPPKELRPPYRPSGVILTTIAPDGTDRRVLVRREEGRLVAVNARRGLFR